MGLNLKIGCGCCAPFNPCTGCAGLFPASFNLLDSNYGPTTLALDSGSGEWRGMGAAPGITGVTQANCRGAAGYPQTTLTAPCRYRFFCTGSTKQLVLSVEFTGCQNGTTGANLPTDAFNAASLSNFSPRVTLARVDNTACAHLDMTFTVANVWTGGGTWNPDGLYAAGGTLRVWAP